jgi:methylmalonyl-CoA mutase N-terminal domain/subunit
MARNRCTQFADEAYALPGEYAATIALRTQQVLAYESGVTNAAIPGRRYFLRS